MTPEAQRIAIAEACGWKWYGGVSKHTDPKKADVGLWAREQDTIHHFLPDYCNDLNAMHEAELKLERNQLPNYTEWIQAMQKRERDEYKWRYIWSATAPQRAEAFLRTIGKWKDL